MTNQVVVQSHKQVELLFFLKNNCSMQNTELTFLTMNCLVYQNCACSSTPVRVHDSNVSTTKKYQIINKVALAYLLASLKRYALNYTVLIIAHEFQQGIVNSKSKTQSTNFHSFIFLIKCVCKENNCFTYKNINPVSLEFQLLAEQRLARFYLSSTDTENLFGTGTLCH